MLQLVTGRAGSGKSEYCMAQIEARADAGLSSMLVVPEQSTFVFERALTLRLGGHRAAFAEVRSFRSLCDDIFAECGGGIRRRAGDAVRCTLVRRAVTQLGREIVCFSRHRRDISFFKLVSSVIDELKNAGITPPQLAEIAATSPSALSKARLCEIAAIYSGYEALLAGRYHDAASETVAAAALAANSRRFDQKAVFFDGFTGFTEPQFALLGNLLPRAESVAVTLCCDGNLDSDHFDAFTAMRGNGRRLLRLAQGRGIETSPLLYLSGARRFTAPGPAALENYLAGDSLPDSIDAKGVFRIDGADRYDEVEQAADEILALVRESGYHFSDIAVIARDIEPYRAAIERLFTLYGIPYFLDANRDLLYSPLTTFILAALEIADGIRTESVLRLLKTGLCDIDTDTIGALENYCFVWDIDRAGWYKPFDHSPDGFGEPDAAAQVALNALESARARVTGWLYPLTQCPPGDAGALLNTVYETVKRCGALAILEQSGSESAREGDLALRMLDSLYDMTTGDALTPAELRDLAALLAVSTPLGETPPALEQLAVGSADRMRTDNPRAVFVLGLNDSVFPRTTFDAPLLTAAERDLLAASGAPLTRGFDNSAAMEEAYFYRALTAASERVYLCRAGRDGAGASLNSTLRIQAFIDTANVPPADSAADPARRIVNSATATRLFADALEAGDSPMMASIEALDIADTETVRRAAAPPDYALRDATLPYQLLGKHTTISATRVEAFSRCRFGYFLRHTLRIQPLQKAEISPIEAGNFVHGVLEYALRESGGDITSQTREQLDTLVTAAADRYLRETLGDAVSEQPRLRYLTGRLQAQSLRLLLQLQSEQRQSLFRPVDFELNIAADSDVQPRTLVTPNGEQVSVIGKVDRVDRLEKDGVSYIRVVDYKTGNREFRLLDVYDGLSVQMLIYLFTIAETGTPRYGAVLPAGVLYMPADPAPASDSTGDPEAAAKKAYRMDGLILDDLAVVEAMEREIAGVYIPVERAKNGALKAGRLASLARLGRIRQHIDKLVLDMARDLYAGDIAAEPTDDSARSCDICDYAALCRRDRIKTVRPLTRKKDSDLFADEEVPDGSQLDN